MITLDLNTFLAGALAIAAQFAIITWAFRQGYQHARYLRRLGLDLDLYEPGPVVFHRQRTHVPFPPEILNP